MSLDRARGSVSADGNAYKLSDCLRVALNPSPAELGRRACSRPGVRFDFACYGTPCLRVYLILEQGNYGGKVAASFSPVQGACLVHGHGRQCLLHEGAAVTSGVKYLLRTDVMYA